MHKVLFLGAHVDDVELGCGGTLYKYRNKWNRICVTLSKSSYSPEGIDGKYPDLWRHQVEALAQLECELQVFAHRTNFFEEERNAIWQTLANLRDAVTPDMVFVNAPDDQQDHACLYRETLRVFQKTSVICYPTYGSTQNFQMNYYEGLSKKYFRTQSSKLSRLR